MGTGLKSFQRRMAAIPREARKATEPALTQAAYIVADAVEALAPEDSGDLKGSVAVTPPGQSIPPYAMAIGSRVVPFNAAAVTVGNFDVRYPHLVEYGTRNALAQPFFWPGVRLTRKKAAAKIKTALRKAIREAKS